MPAAAAMDQRKFLWRAAITKRRNDHRHLRRQHPVEKFGAATMMVFRRNVVLAHLQFIDVGDRHVQAGFGIVTCGIVIQTVESEVTECPFVASHQRSVERVHRLGYGFGGIIKSFGSIPCGGQCFGQRFGFYASQCSSDFVLGFGTL